MCKYEDKGRFISTNSGSQDIIYEKGDVPDDYRKSIIVTIPKKSGTNFCEQFRTLSLLTHVLKTPIKSNKSKNRGKSGAVLKKTTNMDLEDKKAHEKPF